MGMPTRIRTGVKPPTRKRIEPRKEPKQVRASATVSIILDAAARILSEEGYRRFNTNRVAEVAGVSVGSLYQYFPSKDAMLSALLRRHDERQMEALARSLRVADAVPLEQGITGLITGFIDGHLADLDLQRVLIDAPHLEGASAHQANKATGIEAVAAWLASKLGNVPKDVVSLVAFTAVNAVDGVVHAALRDRATDLKSGALGRMLAQMITAYVVASIPGRLEPEDVPASAGVIAKR